MARVEPFAARVDLAISGEGEMARASRMAFAAFVIRVVSAGILYFSQVLFARWLGTHEYGVFVVVWTWVTILAVVAGLGMNMAVLRLLPEYSAQGHMDLVRGLFIGGRVSAAVTATGFALVGCAGIHFYGDIASSPYVMPAYLAAICLPIGAVTDVQDGYARAYSWTDLAFAPTYLWRPLILLSLLGLCLIFGLEMTAVNAMYASILSLLVTCLGQMALMRQRIREEIPAGPRRFDYPAWLKLALPIVFVEGTFSLITGTDILVLSQFTPPQEIAVYYAALKTLALVHFVYFAIKAAFSNRFSYTFHSGDRAGLEATVRMATRYTFWPSLAMAAVLALASPFLLRLFGPEFSAGFPILLILMAGVVTRAAIGPVDALLVMAGQQKVCAIIYSAVLLINLGLNFALVPGYGLYGAATATSLAILVEVLMLIVATRRTLDINVFVFSRPVVRDIAPTATPAAAE
ncbi:MAG: lipopolysaccharide biosynthesis protein [Hyphomicrobiaceae bacterium]|nr:lipopolysaccharide biosynthesis protein [Hyphomicrobiaceae bacterium]